MTKRSGGVPGALRPPARAWHDRVAIQAGAPVVALTNTSAGLVTGAVDYGPGCVRLVPEHGLDGRLDAGAAVLGGPRARPWYFHGHHLPTPDLPAPTEAVFFDLPLVGLRCFTYLDGLRRLIEAAARKDLPVCVLDRPNPLGDLVEGPGFDSAFASEVACAAMPFRYGRSTGAMARYLAALAQAPAPEVIPWDGADPWAAGFPPPSPNLRGRQALGLYPALVWLEGTGISEGRGTPEPFQWCGAPGLDARALVEDVEPPEGIDLVPMRRTPTASKWKGQQVSGVRLEGEVDSSVPVVGFGLRLLAGLARHRPAGLEIKPGPSGRYLLDLLFGSDSLRRSLTAGADPDALASLAKGEWPEVGATPSEGVLT